jgi:hypothetical protein
MVRQMRLEAHLAASQTRATHGIEAVDCRFP